MDIQFQELVTFIGVVLGVLALLGGSLALVRGSYTKARIQGLREDNEDLRSRLDDCDKEETRLKAREEALKAKVASVQSENEALKAMVTQRANVDEVLVRLNAHHEDAMQGQRQLMETQMDAQRVMAETLVKLVQGQERLVVTLERTHGNDGNG
jgi:predicted nuclease with TOPRIM domain